MAVGVIFGEAGSRRSAAIERGRRSVDDVSHDSVDSLEEVRFAGFVFSSAGRAHEGFAWHGDWWVAFSGRVFEVAGVAKELSGVDAASEVAGLLGSMGLRCFKELYGEFAVWAINIATREVVLARDPMGIEPNYYAIHGESVLCGNELRCVSEMRGVPNRICEEQVSRVLVAHLLADVSTELTWVDGILRVPPGCFVTLAPDRCQAPVATRYWDPRTIGRDRLLKGPDAAAELRRRLESAIRVRMDDSSPLGCHLSGGLDSSSIAILLGRARGRFDDIRGFSWTPSECLAYGGTELTRIEFLRHKYQLAVHHPDGDRFLRSSDRWCRVSPEFPNVMVGYEWESLLAASSMGIRRIFSGWGGDEFASHSGLMLGVELASEWRLREAVYWALRFDRGFGLPAFSRALLRLIREFFPLILGSKFWRTPVSLAKRRFDRRSLRAVFPAFPAPLSVASLQESLYFRGHLVNRIESWSSLGALLGIRYEYPLLDQRVVEWCFGIPANLYCNPGRSRAVFRDAVADLWDGFGSDRVPKADSAFQRFIFERGGAGFGNSGSAALKVVENSRLAASLIDEKVLRRTLDRRPWSDPNFVAVLEQCGDVARKCESLDSGYDYRMCIRDLGGMGNRV